MARLELTTAIPPGGEKVLSPEACEFVATLVGRFAPALQELLNARKARQAQWDSGWRPDFLTETKGIREQQWKVADIPADLMDRRVEITGPVERKMVINALNSGANVFMADFEDSLSPTWENVVLGQQNLADAIRKTIRFTQPDTGKVYELGPKTAVLMVRPRGLHLLERHALLDGKPVPASLFDFGLFLFHNAVELKARHSGPYFYLPKMESHREARWWNDVFNAAQDLLKIPRGTIRATVLIETLPAAFEMDEILYELREHSAGLNCGRWDYIFSCIKKTRKDPHAVMPDRALVTMTQPFMRAYTQLLIKTCHRRGIHAMGGMAAQIPIKDDPAANETALQKVRADKLREVTDGHDGTWVAHPGLVPVAKDIFDSHLKTPNQIDKQRDDVNVTAQDLLKVPEGARTEEGVRHNVRVGIRYVEAWLRGQGCVPLFNLMEDAATAEISRAQIWQWLHHQSALSNGTRLTKERLMEIVQEELAAMDVAKGRFAEARDLFLRLCTDVEFTEFLTLPAYERLKS